ncbi:MAG: hypothetical protein IOD12_00265 [Silvanigrellales bacterium]|nr:hypothetical protein [Silvanigrellales bacterium]
MKNSLVSCRFLGVGIFAALAFTACSNQASHDSGSESAQAHVQDVPSTFMQVRKNLNAATVFSDESMNSTLGGVGGGMPLIRDLTKTHSTGVVVMRVNVRGGTFSNKKVWIKASDVEFRTNESAERYRNEAEQLAEQARNAGAQASYWQAAANAARVLCVTGVGAGAALSIVTMGAETVGRSALVSLIGFQTLQPLLSCAGIDPAKFGS